MAVCSVLGAVSVLEVAAPREQLGVETWRQQHNFPRRHQECRSSPWWPSVASSCHWRHSRVLRSDATKQGGGHAPEYPQLVACEGELPTLQVNHFEAERLDQVEVEQVGGWCWQVV